MRIDIDLTAEGDDFGSEPLADDFDMVLQFGDAHVRMTYAQFEIWLERANKWMTAIPDETVLQEQGGN